jgi:two-component system sensor histidine kinase TctE
MSDTTARRTSIRSRLLQFLLGSLLLMVVGAAVVTYIVAVHAANDAYDRSLLDPVVDIAENITIGPSGPRVDLPRKAIEALTYDQIDRVIYQVRAADGRIVDGAADLPEPRIARSEDYVFFDGVHLGEPIRVAALRKADGFVVQVGETLHKRSRLIREILVAELIPTLLVAGVAIALAWIGVARGLEPLERVRGYLLGRQTGDLRPIPEIGAPVEIEPVMDAFNGLIAQLRNAIETRQRFLADAAHQLRTPIAGLQMHLELLSLRDLPPDIRAEVARMRTATARAGRLANQLLVLARAESAPEGRRPKEIVDLLAVAEDAARNWAPKAIAQQVDLGFALEPALIFGEASLVPEILDNLIDNALRYTPAGGAVTVSTGTDDATVFLSVEDTGPGIPEAERAKVLERFYRINGAGPDGSGLGLAIVREIAENNRGRVDIRASATGGGTCVRVTFPRSAGVRTEREEPGANPMGDRHSSYGRSSAQHGRSSPRVRLVATSPRWRWKSAGSVIGEMTAFAAKGKAEFVERTTEMGRDLPTGHAAQHRS